MAVHFETREHVAVLTLDRPEALNALDLDSLHSLRSCLQQYRDDARLRALVLTGQGGRSFCTGADLKGTRNAPATYAAAMFGAKAASGEQGLYIRLMDLSDLNLWKPVIAAIDGYCLGGGLELALQCDIRIASEQASFGLPEVCSGSIPAVAGVYRLIKATGSSQALQMALTGERVPAAHALASGLVSEVVPRERLLPRAIELAQRIAANAPLAVQAVKKLSRQASHLSEADAQELTELFWGALRDTRDRQEGRTAFADKRRPHFTGQ